MYQYLPNSQKVFLEKLLDPPLAFSKKFNQLKNKYHMKVRENTKLFICSIYHPNKHNEQLDFYSEFNKFFKAKPHNTETLIGAYVNCNLIIRTPMLCGTIWPHELDSQNQKRKDLLYLLRSNNFKIILSYFNHKNYITYRSFNAQKIHIH